MKIVIATIVEQDYETVFDRFDEKLFLKLAPPFIPLNLQRFDGCMVGDEVHLVLGKGFFKQEWHAKIIEQQKTESEIYFIDTGALLPKPLKHWKHRHRIIKKGNQSEIIDDIAYSTGNKLLDIIMYPIMYLQFWIRKPIYKAYFKTNR